jgi:hypothetical protein
MSDTVKLSISIEISATDEDCDTGLTVERWNALTGAQRSRIVTDIWNEMAASADGGGISVVTDGAEEV